MSDWSMYKFEETIWEEFQGDHIVPLHEETSITNTTGDRSAPGYTHQARAQFGSVCKSGRKLLEKDSVAYSPSLVLPSSDSDSFKEESGLMLEDNMTPSYSVQSNIKKANGSELCERDTIISLRNSCDNYLFNEMSDDDLNFIEKTEDKDPRDCLYYGWPEIGNFEDVDMMFRDCDSTYGFEDGTDSFSSAYNMGESMDVPEPDFKFPGFRPQAVLNFSENQNSSKSFSTIDSMSSFGDNNDSSCAPETHISFKNADGKHGFNCKQEINEHQEKVKLQNQLLVEASQFEVQDGQFSAGNFNDDEGGSQVFDAESDSLNVTTTAKSGHSDNSTGASSFHRLQLVMEQLDLGTRLCIKDCLYRLAQSADQRQKHLNLNGDCGDERDSNASGERNETTFPEDMETDTNPIDRSIAHLLFYTASGSSAIHA